VWQHQRHVDEVAAAMLERVALPPGIRIGWANISTGNLYNVRR